MDLKDEIGAEIERDGPIPFSRFMELALYHPEHGYYTAGPRRAGAEWTTAPTLHPIFGKTLARGMAPLLAQLEAPRLVEAGCGSGELMRDVAYGLAEVDPATFERLELVLVDRSQPSLERALSTLEQAGILLDAVEARTELPEDVEGVILSNELLDAIPPHLAEATSAGSRERYVSLDEDGQMILEPGPPSSAKVAKLARQLGREARPGTRFEVPLQALAWYQAACQHLDRGAVVTIDYGSTASAIQQAIPEGTLHGYLRGRPTTDVLARPGQVDLTYLVPFDHVARTGEQAGLTTEAYATQETMLEQLGIRSFADEMDTMDVLAAKKLIDPEGAGGTFQWLVQAKGIDVPTPWPQQARTVEGPEDPPAPWQGADRILGA